MARTRIHFLTEERGSATLEFVIWTPFLMFWLIISAVFHDAYRNLDLATKASYTLADLISRQTVLEDASDTSPDIADLVYLQRALMPSAGRDMTLRITSIQCVRPSGCYDAGGGYAPAVADFRVTWSVVPARPDWPVGFTPPVPLVTGAEPDEPQGVPIGLVPPMAELDVVLLVDIEVPYQPFSSPLGLERRIWEFRIPVRPRFVPAIELVTSEPRVYVES